MNKTAKSMQPLPSLAPAVPTLKAKKSAISQTERILPKITHAKVRKNPPIALKVACRFMDFKVVGGSLSGMFRSLLNFNKTSLKEAETEILKGG